jgi:DNA-directed RNA polymerase specialized sigma24 family protein
MDRETEAAQLPELHAAALKLRDRGLQDDAIAATLGIEPQAVRSLLQLAERKLAALQSITASPARSGR